MGEFFIFEGFIDLNASLSARHWLFPESDIHRLVSNS
jgi:hypothetical protein